MNTPPFGTKRQSQNEFHLQPNSLFARNLHWTSSVTLNPCKRRWTTTWIQTAVKIGLNQPYSAVPRLPDIYRKPLCYTPHYNGQNNGVRYRGVPLYISIYIWYELDVALAYITETMFLLQLGVSVSACLHLYLQVSCILSVDITLYTIPREAQVDLPG